MSDRDFGTRGACFNRTCPRGSLPEREENSDGIRLHAQVVFGTLQPRRKSFIRL
jgi:hypothetical protein